MLLYLSPFFSLLICSFLTATESIGFFSGTFDPMHNCHVRMVIECQTQLDLDEIWVMPNYISPLKPQLKTHFETRLYMAELALEGIEKVKVSDYKKQFTQAVYQANTPLALANEYPEKVFHFIIGVDAFLQYTRRKDYSQLLNKVNLVLVTRPGGYDLNFDEQAQAYINHSLVGLEEFDKEKRGQIIFLSLPDCIEISSSAVRKKIGQGKSVAGLLRPKLLSFIQEQEIYE